MIATPPSGGEVARLRAHLEGPITFLFGAAIAGVCFGGILGALGKLPFGEPVANICLVVTIVLSIAERQRRMRLYPPSSGWQVPREWGMAGRLRFSLVFGLLLGLGTVTIVTSWTTYVLLAGAIAQADVVRGASIIGTFGLVRGVPMLLVAVDPGAHILPSGRDVRMMQKLRRLGEKPEMLLRRAEIAMLGFIAGGIVRGFWN